MDSEISIKGNCSASIPAVKAEIITSKISSPICGTSEIILMNIGPPDVYRRDEVHWRGRLLSDKARVPLDYLAESLSKHDFDKVSVCSARKTCPGAGNAVI
jgi:hypothetical protein